MSQLQLLQVDVVTTHPCPCQTLLIYENHPVVFNCFRGPCESTRESVPFPPPAPAPAAAHVPHLEAFHRPQHTRQPQQAQTCGLRTSRLQQRVVRVIIANSSALIRGGSWSESTSRTKGVMEMIRKQKKNIYNITAVVPQKHNN